MVFESVFAEEDEVMAEINMTPLVDVMLVLLIIFIVTAPLMTRSIPVDLPRTAGSPAAMDAEPVRLSLDGKGRLYWNEEQIDDNELAPRLSAAAKATAAPEVQLAADRGTRYERIADILAAVKAVGITRLGFVIQAQRMP